MATRGYCVKCRKKVEMQPPLTTETLNNGSEALVGYCPNCNSEVFRIITKRW